MTKRPNKMGRIEGEPKVKWQRTKKAWAVAPYIVVPVVLVTLGVAGTLGYQNYVSNLKAEGVAEYKLTCDKFTDKDKKVTWLECDE